MWQTQGNGFTQGISKPKEFNLSEFNPSSLSAFKNSVNAAFEMGQPIFPIYIDSYGGNADIMTGFISVMETYRKQGMIFATVVSGMAMSAGAIIFCYGDPDMRFMADSASLMLHGIQTGIEGRAVDVQKYSSYICQVQKSMFEKISRHLKKKPDWLEKEMKREMNSDYFLSAKESVEKGLASVIGVPIFNLEMEPKFGWIV